MRFVLNDVEKKKFVSLFEQHEKNIDYMFYLRDMVFENSNISSSLFENKNVFEKRTLFVFPFLIEFMIHAIKDIIRYVNITGEL